MATILAFYEGVLESHKKGRPIMDGQMLLHSLAEGNRLVVATSGGEDRVFHQLKIARLDNKVVEIIDKRVALNPMPLWQRQIESARSKWTVTIVLAADPDIIEYAVEHGVVGLYFAHPGFSRPAQRPDQSKRAWTELTQEMEARL